MKRSGRKAAAVGMLTGGLLLLGLVPAYAGSVTVDDGADGAAVSVSPADSEAADPTDAAAKDNVAEQDSAMSGQPAKRAQVDVPGLGCDPLQDEDCPELPEDCNGDDIPDPGGCDGGGGGDDCDPVENPEGCFPDPDGPEDPGNPDEPGGDGDQGNDENNGGGNGQGSDGGSGSGGSGSGGADGGSGSGSAEGGPGNDPEQAEPEGVVPGAEPAQSTAATQACHDPSLCQELDDPAAPAASPATAPEVLGDLLTEAGAAAPVPAGVLAAAGATLVLTGAFMLRTQLRPRPGAHRQLTRS